MAFKAIIILSLLCVIVLVDGNDCTLKCDALFPISPDIVQICGTDGDDHSVPVAALFPAEPPWTCYFDCNVGVRYPGTCACPNYCNERSGKGNCTASGCTCFEGWGGTDCSAIVCPNACSNHGQCVNDTGTGACLCDSGYTGFDCSVEILDLPSLPYGNVFPGQPYAKDAYGDYHPVFNLTVMAKIEVFMDADDYNTMLTPVDSFNQSFFKANASFSNGNIEEHFKHARIKQKGKHSRFCTKKTFTLEFDHKHKTKLFYDLSEIALKAPSQDWSYTHNQIIVEYFRAMIVPVSRGSFGTLSINGIFWGLYWLNEEYDEQFAISRFGADTGNLYEMNTYLYYLGLNATSYKDATYESMDMIFKNYELRFGDDTFTDLAIWARFLNASTDDEFVSQVQIKLNVNNFIRALIVESAVDIVDGYTSSGDNWAMYNLNGTWEFMEKDFEYTMFDPFHNAYDSCIDNLKVVAARRLMTVSSYHDIFNKYYPTFLSDIFDPSLADSSTSRVTAMQPFLRAIIEIDEWYRITNGVASDEYTFDAAIDGTKLFLDTRYDVLKAEFLL